MQLWGRLCKLSSNTQEWQKHFISEWLQQYDENPLASSCVHKFKWGLVAQAIAALHRVVTKGSCEMKHVFLLYTYLPRYEENEVELLKLRQRKLLWSDNYLQETDKTLELESSPWNLCSKSLQPQRWLMWCFSRGNLVIHTMTQAASDKTWQGI